MCFTNMRLSIVGSVGGTLELGVGVDAIYFIYLQVIGTLALI